MRDLRLVPIALGTWGATLTVLYTDWRVAAGLVAASVMAGLAGHRWAGAWRWIVLAVAAGVICGAVATGARVTVRDAPQVQELISDRVTATVTLTLRGDPRPLAPITGRQVTWLVPARLTQVAPAGTAGEAFRLDAGVLVLATAAGWAQLVPGQQVTALARFGPARGGDLNAAVLSAAADPALVHAPPWYQGAAARLRVGLRLACAGLDPRVGGLLPGLVVGDVSRMPPALAQQFREVGLTHLTAVSGSNLAIVAGTMLLLARWCRLGAGWSVLIAALAVLFFVILARPEPSVLRAAVMGGVGLLALATGRNRLGTPALAATAILLMLAEPALAADAGFALSVCATGGLLLLAPRLRDSWHARGVPMRVAEALAVPVSAQLACAPIVAGISGTVSVVGVLANLLAAPAVAPATLCGVAAAAVSPFWPGGAQFLAWLGGWPTWWLVLVAEHGSRLPAAEVSWPGGVAGGVALAGVVAAVLWAIRSRPARRIVLVLALGVALGAAPVRLLAAGWPPPGWLVVACDVGQGDAIVLNAGPGAAVVVDVGPHPRHVDRCLRELGVHRIPLVMISHFHTDHIGGMAGLWPGRDVGELLTTSWREPAAGRHAVLELAAEHAVQTRLVQPGAGWTVGEVNLRVLPGIPMRGTRSDANNNSMIVMAAIRGVRILLLGDAEVEQQSWLRETGTETSALVLKVAHHGSAFQDPELLEAIGPAVALVSAGSGNRYGHPHPAVLSALVRAGAQVWRTDIAGDIAVALDSGGLRVLVRGPIG